MPAAGRIPALTTLGVLLVIAATAALLVFNPWLMLWLLAGVLAGWAVRTIGREVHHRRSARHDSEPQTAFATSPWEATSAVIGLVGLVAAVTLTAVTALFPKAAAPPDPTVVVVVPATYDARAALVDTPGSGGGESFSLAEEVRVSEAAIAAYANEQGTMPREAADELAATLARTGWRNPQLRAGALRLERPGRPVPVDSSVWPPRTTVTFLVPPELRRVAPFVLDGGSVDVSGPRHALLETSPASEAKPLAAGLEQREVTLEAADERVSVEVAHPGLRNALGAFLLGLSAGALAKGAVLLVWGLFLDQIKDGLKAIFKRRKNEPPPQRRPRRTTPKAKAAK